jgi:hypothetical protein
MSEFNKAVKDYELSLYDLVARHLAGRPVEIQWRQPYCDDFIGLAVREAKKAVIQIAPDLDSQEKLRVFLHECAHVRLDYDRLSQSGDHKKEPGSYYLPDPKAYHKLIEKRENPVDSWAAYWLNYAEMSAKSDSTISKLTALLKWRK